MDKLINKKALLDTIRLSESVDFELNEEAILEEYRTQGEQNATLAIKVLSIFGGFLATLAFIGFLLIAGLYDSEIGLLTFGIGFIITAIWLNKKYNKLIIDTFSVSTYVIGFALIAFGLGEMNVEENTITILIIAIAFCSLFITQNYILSFISILTISCCSIILIISNEAYLAIHLYVTVVTLMLTYLFLNESKLISSDIKIAKLYDPARIGLIISLLFGLIAIGKKNLIPISQNYVWLSSIVMVLVIIYLVYTLLEINEVNDRKNKMMVYTLSGLILLSTVLAPSISGAILITFLSFLVNYKTGLAIGVIALVYFISQYYYDLNYTLLTKSIILFVSGVLFLLLYLFTTKKLNTNEEI